MCGGTPFFSPRAMFSAGSIPACAGEPGKGYCSTHLHRVYPRVCGGTGIEAFATWMAQGLSPRVRGNRDRGVRYLDGAGSIPACAGEPAYLSATRQFHRVYPRVCGGTRRMSYQRVNENGLSPRVRGNLSASTYDRAHTGSIPACAGEPKCQHIRPRTYRVYPRVCGGTKSGFRASRPEQGLSPRVRGNLSREPLLSNRGGSIPACAGEPSKT